MSVSKGEKQLAARRKNLSKRVTYHPRFCELLIEHMSTGLSFETFNIEGTYVARSALYNWLKKHPEFKEAKEIGDAASLAKWEQMGIRGLTQDKFKTPNWVFQMKNRFRWTEKVEVEQNISGTITHQTVMDYIKGGDVKELTSGDDEDEND